MNVLLIALLTSLVVAVVLKIAIRPHLGVNVRRNQVIFLVNAVVGMLIGVSLLISSSDDVAHGIEIRSWPEAPGIVTATAIGADSRHRPEITVRFTVDSAEYSALCDLGVSGFGSKKYRKNTADKIITQYAVGSAVTVRYNPEDLEEATLRKGLRWAPLMRLTVGALFCATGLFFLFALLFPARKSAAE